jgi:leucyl/phenylalanyl-tRNA--protein transferase
VLRAENVHLGATLRRRLRREGWETTVDEAFAEVVRCCADRTYVWITPALQETYGELHRRGRAYSLEVWSPDGRLIAGTFGIRTGRIFSVESLFHTEDHASKAAMVDLVSRVRAAGGVGVDCQYPAQHFSALGAELIDRKAFRRLLTAGLDAAPHLATKRLPVARLVDPLSADAVDLPSDGATAAHS